ncbi:MAG: Yip1 family protein [Chloroflexota bacterium]|nr:Yip1 family protein [Chloroflexota bacterium]
MNGASIAVQIMHRPAEALKRAVDHPRSWWMPALLIVASMALLIGVSAPQQVALANEQAGQMLERITRNMSAEQAEMIRQRSQSMTVPRYWVTAGGVGLILAALGWLLRGGLVHLLSALFGGVSEWKGTLCVSVWSMFPGFVRNVVQALYVGINGTLIEHQGFAGLVATGDSIENSRDVIYTLLSNVDPFSLWHLVLFAIGISVAIKVSRAKGAFLAVVIWLFLLGVKLLPLALANVFGVGALG